MSTSVRRRDGGYATFPNRWVDAGFMAKAPGSVTQVYLFLCRWSDNATLEAAQPMRLIAKKSGLSEDVARKAIRTLESWGVLHREAESGPNACNIWTLCELPATAPDYPDKVPPKQRTTPQESGVVKSAPPESGGPESGGPYQPNLDQPETSQPERDHSDESKSFDQFWSAYPRKAAKKDAVKAWEKAEITDEEFPAVLAALEQHKRSPQWTRNGGQYIPYPATWINGRRWEDELSGPGGNIDWLKQIANGVQV